MKLARIFHGLRLPVKYPLWPQHDAAKVSARRKRVPCPFDFAQGPEPVEGLKVNPEHERRKLFTSKPVWRTLHIAREMFGLTRKN